MFSRNWPGTRLSRYERKYCLNNFRFKHTSGFLTGNGFQSGWSEKKAEQTQVWNGRQTKSDRLLDERLREGCQHQCWNGKNVNKQTNQFWKNRFAGLIGSWFAWEPPFPCPNFVSSLAFEIIINECFQSVRSQSSEVSGVFLTKLCTFAGKSRGNPGRFSRRTTSEIPGKRNPQDEFETHGGRDNQEKVHDHLGHAEKSKQNQNKPQKRK